MQDQKKDCSSTEIIRTTLQFLIDLSRDQVSSCVYIESVNININKENYICGHVPVHVLKMIWCSFVASLLLTEN